jgi:Fe2+ or Zn2+ uptake regulation protein
VVQEEVIRLLEECQEALSCSEIVEKMLGKANSTAVNRALKQLSKYGEIQAIKLELPVARRIFGNKAKHKLQVYCIVS